MAGDVRRLKVFQLAYALSLDVHRASLGWRREEQFGGVADQLRRATKSVCALLVEGAGRRDGSEVEFRRYVLMALGSADEAALWCSYAADLDLSPRAQAQAWEARSHEIARMLQGLLKSRPSLTPDD